MNIHYISISITFYYLNHSAGNIDINVFIGLCNGDFAAYRLQNMIRHCIT